MRAGQLEEKLVGDELQVRHIIVEMRDVGDGRILDARCAAGTAVAALVIRNNGITAVYE